MAAIPSRRPAWELIPSPRSPKNGMSFLAVLSTASLMERDLEEEE